MTPRPTPDLTDELKQISAQLAELHRQIKIVERRKQHVLEEITNRDKGEIP